MDKCIYFQILLSVPCSCFWRDFSIDNTPSLVCQFFYKCCIYKCCLYRWFTFACVRRGQFAWYYKNLRNCSNHKANQKLKSGALCLTHLNSQLVLPSGSVTCFTARKKASTGTYNLISRGKLKNKSPRTVHTVLALFLLEVEHL